jgi:two-component system, chemotaxis family, protein-glutamate methylesterase/glutaminase
MEAVAMLGEHAPATSTATYNLKPKPAQASAPAAMVIAASTSGFSALQAFLAPIARRIEAPILIVQHMPAGCAPAFASKLEQMTGKHCRVAADCDVLAPGTMLLAPGGQHMRVARCPAGRMVHLDAGEPVNACRPAADPLFESAVLAFGSRLLAVVLSGAGRDACAGAGRIAAAGGRVIVQDEASCDCWDMPGAVAAAGHAEAVKPLKDLSHLALRVMNGEVA